MAMDLPLSPNRPFVLKPDGQTFIFCGIGICDPALASSVSGLLPFIFDTALFTWGVAADAANLVMPSGQQRALFDTGIGELIAGGWWTKTISDTTALRTGALVGNNLKFYGMGLMAEALRPFQRGGAGTAAADARLIPAWLGNQDNGPGYGFEIQRAMLDYTALTVRFGDTGVELRGGNLAHLPHFGQPRGAQSLSNGGLSVINYLPFATAITIGGQNDTMELEMLATFGQSVEIQSSTPPTENGVDNAVYAPVRVSVVGMQICVVDSNICGMPTSAIVAGGAAGRGGYYTP